MLLSKIVASWLRRMLAGVCGLFIWCAASVAADEMPSPLWKMLNIDPLLGAYLDSGCTINVSVSADDDKPVLNGNFRVLTADSKVVIDGTFHNNRLEGDMRTFGTGGVIIALERYKNGRLTGERIEWDEAGNVRIVTRYNDEGKKAGVERYFANGVVWMEIDWQGGTPSEIRYFKEGNQVERLRGQAMWNRLKANMDRSNQTDKESSKSEPHKPTKAR